MGGMAVAGSGCLGSLRYLGDVKMNEYVISGKIWRVKIIFFAGKLSSKLGKGYLVHKYDRRDV